MYRRTEQLTEIGSQAHTGDHTSYTTIFIFKLEKQDGRSVFPHQDSRHLAMWLRLHVHTSQLLRVLDDKRKRQTTCGDMGTWSTKNMAISRQILPKMNMVVKPACFTKHSV